MPSSKRPQSRFESRAHRAPTRLDCISSGNALVTTYGYDTNTGELVSIDYSDPDTPDISHTYGRRGERVRTVDGSGTIDYGYNDALQLQTETHARSNGTHVITRTHESNGTGTVAGRLSGVRLQSPGAPAYRLDYGYDAFGRHSTFTSHHGDTQRTATYGWIPDSHLLAGIDHGGLLHTTYRYEPHRDVKTTVSNWVAAAGPTPVRNLSTYAHHYSADRRRVNVVNTGEAFAQAAFNLFDYNARNEVVRSLRHLGSDTTQTNNEVAAEARRYEYDPIGNRLLSESGHSNLTTYLSNQLNQYTNTTESGVSNKIHHDPDGNLTSDARFVYEWNGENRLVTATPVTPTNGAKQVRNDYDHQGRRWRKRVHTWDGSTWTLTETRTFVYDGWNMIQETVDHVTAPDELLHYDWGLDLSLSLQGAGGVGGPPFLLCFDFEHG